MVSATLSFTQSGVGDEAEHWKASLEMFGLILPPATDFFFFFFNDSGLLSLILGLYFLICEMRGWIRCIHLFKKYVLCASCVLVVIPAAGQTSVNRIDKHPCFCGADIFMEKN